MNSATGAPIRMEASEKDPWLGVYVLSQFVFCPRAGINAHESPVEPDEEGEPSVRLDLMPRYDLQEVQQAFSAVVNRIIWLVMIIVAGVFIFMHLVQRVHPDFAFLGAVVEIGLLLYLAPNLVNAWELHHRMQILKTSKPKEPDPDKEEIQDVDWAELLKAGFMSVPCNERLSHEAWKLKGKPWRILRRKNMHIPVFLRPNGNGKLHKKYLVKVAAYCHLLQATANAESPYGIVLTTNSFAGVAVPNNPASRKPFHDTLRQARGILMEAKAGQVPPEPTQLSLCHGCPFGKPIPYQPGETEHESNGKTLEIMALSDGSSIKHSHCGDRFQWIPPHELVEKLKLRSV